MTNFYIISLIVSIGVTIAIVLAGKDPSFSANVMLFIAILAKLEFLKEENGK